MKILKEDVDKDSARNIYLKIRDMRFDLFDLLYDLQQIAPSKEVEVSISNVAGEIGRAVNKLETELITAEML